MLRWTLVVDKFEKGDIASDQNTVLNFIPLTENGAELVSITVQAVPKIKAIVQQIRMFLFLLTKSLFLRLPRTFWNTFFSSLNICSYTVFLLNCLY